jgi:hypothetical protein
MAAAEVAEPAQGAVFFEAVTLGALAAFVMLGVVFWALGERKRRAGLVGIAIPAAASTEPPPQPAR